MSEAERALQREAPGEAPLFRRLSAELVGTLLLVAVGTGAATVLSLGPLERLGRLSDLLAGAPGNNRIFGELLGSTLGDTLGVALSFGIILAVLVYAFGGVSGGHFNPAVTIALAVARRFRWSEVPLYVIVQCVGGIGGAFIVAGIYGQDGAALGGQDLLLGATVVASGVGQWNAILAEAFIAFILVTAIMAVAVDPRAPKGWSGLMIGLALGGGIMVTAQATGGSANFARSLGPFVASLLYDVGEIPWGDLVVYAAGPVVGAAAAALVYDTLTGLERVSPAPRPGAATPQGAGEEALAHAEHHTPGLAPTGEDDRTESPPPPGL